jgi:hypothetical protein
MIEQDAGRWTEAQNFDFDPELIAIHDEVFINAVRVARQLLRLLEQRGWTGWTKLEHSHLCLVADEKAT